MLKTTTVLFLISLSVLAGLHLIALALYLYWQVWWFDIPMHILGGATVVLGLHTVVDLRLASRELLLTPLNACILVLTIAISWEMFQYAVTEVGKPDYVADTLLDITLGLVGGVVGYTVGARLQDSQLH